MPRGARSPEELEVLFEDAFLMGDRDAVARMFEEGGVLVAGNGSDEAHGEEAHGVQRIAEVVTALWQRNHTYFAEPRRVIQARDTALVLGDTGLSVMRRDGEGIWRYAISMVLLDGPNGREGHR